MMVQLMTMLILILYLSNVASFVTTLCDNNFHIFANIFFILVKCSRSCVYQWNTVSVVDMDETVQKYSLFYQTVDGRQNTYITVVCFKCVFCHWRLYKTQRSLKWSTSLCSTPRWGTFCFSQTYKHFAKEKLSSLFCQRFNDKTEVLSQVVNVFSLHWQRGIIS